MSGESSAARNRDAMATQQKSHETNMVKVGDKTFGYGQEVTLKDKTYVVAGESKSGRPRLMSREDYAAGRHINEPTSGYYPKEEDLAGIEAYVEPTDVTADAKMLDQTPPPIPEQARTKQEKAKPQSMLEHVMLRKQELEDKIASGDTNPTLQAQLDQMTNDLNERIANKYTQYQNFLNSLGLRYRKEGNLNEKLQKEEKTLSKRLDNKKEMNNIEKNMKKVVDELSSIGMTMEDAERVAKEMESKKPVELSIDDVQEVTHEAPPPLPISEMRKKFAPTEKKSMEMPVDYNGQIRQLIQDINKTYGVKFKPDGTLGTLSFLSKRRNNKLQGNAEYQNITDKLVGLIRERDNNAADVRQGPSGRMERTSSAAAGIRAGSVDTSQASYSLRPKKESYGGIPQGAEIDKNAQNTIEMSNLMDQFRTEFPKIKIDGEGNVTGYLSKRLHKKLVTGEKPNHPYHEHLKRMNDLLQNIQELNKKSL